MSGIEGTRRSSEEVMSFAREIETGGQVKCTEKIIYLYRATWPGELSAGSGRPCTTIAGPASLRGFKSSWKKVRLNFGYKPRICMHPLISPLSLVSDFSRDRSTRPYFKPLFKGNLPFRSVFFLSPTTFPRVSCALGMRSNLSAIYDRLPSKK